MNKRETDLQCSTHLHSLAVRNNSHTEVGCLEQLFQHTAHLLVATTCTSTPHFHVNAHNSSCRCTDWNSITACSAFTSRISLQDLLLLFCSLAVLDPSVGNIMDVQTRASKEGNYSSCCRSDRVDFVHQ